MSDLHKDSAIYVAGHRGMVGSALVRRLSSGGYSNLITRTRAELDLVDQAQVREFFNARQIDAVLLAAARVGGIWANHTAPAEFIYENLLIEANVIHAAWQAGVRRLLFLGSSCIYPRDAAQPMREEALLDGKLEPTNEPYAVAKIAGIKLCESYNRQYGTDFRSVMPCNLYGPGDNYDAETSHVIPALIRRFHEAKQAAAERVVVWGSGRPRREFLYVGDMADASVRLLELGRARYESQLTPMQSHLNLGAGKDLEIGALARLIRDVTGYQGAIAFDASRPDGPAQKLMDNTRLEALVALTYTPLERGLAHAYADFLLMPITAASAQAA